MNEEGEGSPRSGTLVAMAAAVVVIWATSGIVVHYFFPTWADSGTFGDTFGAINALFSGLAFAGLIYTVLLQRNELALQRQELYLTRQEMRGQRDQMEAQAATLKLEQFESTFFQLLKVHGDIVNAIDLVIRGGGGVIHGRDCFRVFCKRFELQFDRPRRLHAELDHIRASYAEFYEAHEAEVGHYFRHLYHIVKFVDQSDVADKRRYTSFVRAQLSSNEIELLFYNCLSEQGAANFKPLVEKYGLLKHRPTNPGVVHHRRHFQPAAFLSANAPQEELDRVGAISSDEWKKP